MLRFFSAFIAALFLFPIVVFSENCSARSAIVIDADTNEIIYEKNIYEKLSIASTTKIMTALIACESGKMNETVTVTNKMVDTIGTSLGLKAGNKISLCDLVTGMLVVSGNDAANAVAYYLAGTLEKFAALMNKKALEIGMRDSLFVTPSGLDEGNHHSTAYDMAILTSCALKNEAFAKICSLKKAEIIVDMEKRTIYNHNKLLSFLDDCVGVKTGFTEKAGRCLVSTVKRNEKKLICVTLSDPNDWDDHIALYEECEKKYKKINMHDTLNVEAVGGLKNFVSASYSADISVLNEKNITVEIYHFPFVYTPVKRGAQIGNVIIKYKEKEISSVPLSADEDVDYYGG